MLPFFAQPVWHIGPLSIHAFGIAVAIAMWVGFTMFDHRIHHVGLDQLLAQKLGAWAMIGGILGAHLFAVLVYFPELVRSDPWLLLRVWERISSLGGMLGGVVGALLFFAFRARNISRSMQLAYLDAIAFVFPAALAIGRFGCALAHDHVGRVTTFPLSFSLNTIAAQEVVRDAYSSSGLELPAGASGLGFYDLGLIEFLFLAVMVIPLFRWLNRTPRANGFYLAAFAASYLPVRFAMDALRVGDVRYVGLTPAQWVAAIVVTVLPFLVIQRRSVKFALAGTVILLAGWACASGSR